MNREIDEGMKRIQGRKQVSGTIVIDDKGRCRIFSIIFPSAILYLLIEYYELLI